MLSAAALALYSAAVQRDTHKLSEGTAYTSCRCAAAVLLRDDEMQHEPTSERLRSKRQFTYCTG